MVSFVGLVLKNLLRQKVRAGLTLLGITVGITTVVALGAITSGFKASSGGLITARGADLMVAQRGAADLSFSTIPEDALGAVAAVPGVARAEGSLFHITRAGSNLFFFLVGVDPGALVTNPPSLSAGRLLAAGAEREVLLGEGAAKDLGVEVGDQVELSDLRFAVVGIYRSDGLLENNGAYTDLATVQTLTAKPRVLSVIHVGLAPGASLEETARTIETTVPSVVTIVDIDDIGKVDQGIKVLDAANIAISLLAVGIGAIGVMNTMVMSVFERTREIGIFRAVGWSGSRVFRMILTESLILCVVAAGLGIGLGVAIAEAVTLVPAVENLLVPAYSGALLVRAVGVAVVVAVAGALYPAFRAVRLTPLEALRYE
ncbi:MAG: ABC transporter permease [Dehalococcoidia bacterium]